LLWVGFAFAVGIWFSHFAWRPPTWWMMAAAMALLCAAWLAKHRPAASRALGVAAVFAAGALTLQLRNASTEREAGISALASGGEYFVTAHVVREGHWRSAGFGGSRQAIDVETEELIAEGRVHRLRAGLRLSIYSKEKLQEYPGGPGQASRLFRYGERLRFPAKLTMPRNFRNPGAFDYREYLADRGIAALGSTRDEEVEVLAGFEGSRWQLWRSQARASMLSKVHSLWPGPQAALIDAMVIGEDAFIEPDTKVDFQRSGTYHVLVVSGMNLSILAFVCFWTLRRLRIGDTWAGLLTIGLSVAYAFLTDVGPPIWRATFMLTLVIWTRLVYRARSMLNAMGGAAFALLAFEPRALFGSSFQLTFLSVLVIGAIAIPILERTTQPYHRGMAHPWSVTYDAKLAPRVAQLRLDLRMLAGRLRRFVPMLPMLPGMARMARWSFGMAEVLLVSALMQLGLALPMAYWFHRATVMGLPANALVVPLTELLMPAAALAVAAAYCGLWVAKVPALVTSVALEGIAGTVKWLGGLRIADVRVATPAVTVMLCAGVALIVAAMLVRRRWWMTSSGIAGMLMAALWICAVPPAAQVRRGALEITALDVGQGDSTLIVTPEGKAVLLDAGGPLGGQHSTFDFGEQVVSPYLWARGISRLDAVIVSHGHSDHIGGMPAILRNFRPREMWIGITPDSEEFRDLLSQAKVQGVTVKEYFEGDEQDFGGAHVRVFAPARNERVAKARNNDSMVLTFSYGNSSAMLEGDAEQRVERHIVLQQPGQVSLLKIPHNGSATSTSPEWLATLRPEFAVISVGARNTFGHPRMETLQKLSGARVKTYRTDLDGAVSFYLTGDSVTAATAPR